MTLPLFLISIKLLTVGMLLGGIIAFSMSLNSKRSKALNSSNAVPKKMIAKENIPLNGPISFFKFLKKVIFFVATLLLPLLIFRLIGII